MASTVGITILSRGNNRSRRLTPLVLVFVLVGARLNRFRFSQGGRCPLCSTGGDPGRRTRETIRQAHTRGDERSEPSGTHAPPPDFNSNSNSPRQRPAFICGGPPWPSVVVLSVSLWPPFRQRPAFFVDFTLLT